jgi:hypothetical protein
MERDVADPGVELNVDIRHPRKLLVQDARELGLLALHPVGMTGHVGDGAEIELRQHAVRLAAILELGRDQPLLDQRLCGAECLEHVQRRRVKSRCTRFVAQVMPGLEHRHRDALACQVRRRHQANRPGAGDQYALRNCH